MIKLSIQPQVRGKFSFPLRITNVFFPAIIIISLASLVFIWFLGKDTQKNVEETVIRQYGGLEMEIAGQVAVIMGKMVSGLKTELEITARIPAVRDIDLKNCTSTLEKIYEGLEPKIFNFGRVNKEGVMVCSVTKENIGRNFATSPNIAEVLSTKKAAIGRMLKSQTTGEYLFTIHVPVFSAKGEFTGTLGGAINLSKLRENYFKNISFTQGGYVVLQDDNGDILYHPDPELLGRNLNDEYMKKVLDESKELQDLIKEAQAGATGTKKYIYKGELRLAVYKPAHIAEGRFWPVVVTVPEKEIKGFVAPVLAGLQYRSLASMAIVLVFALGLIISFRQRGQILEKKVQDRTKELERRAYQAEVLRELNERVGYSLDLAKIIEIITGSVGRLLDYHVIAYMTQNNDRVLFKCDLKESVNHAFVSDVKSKMLDAFSAMLNKQLKADEVDESITGAIFDEETKDPVGSFFNLPLIIGEKVVGLITIASPKAGLYTEEETAILYTITTQASTAVTKLNEVLEREKGKLNSMVATLDDGVLMIGSHWDLVVINTQARKLLGLDPALEVGTLDVLDKLSGKIDIRTKIEKATAKNETIAPTEITLGEKIIQVVILQVKDKDDENLGAVVVLHDITQERKARAIIEEEVKERTKQLKEEQVKLNASINSLNVGFFIVDPKGEIVMINPLAKRILCFAPTGGVIRDADVNNFKCTMADIEKDLKSVFDLRIQIKQSIEQRKPIQVKNLAYKNMFLHIFISPIVVMEQKLEVIGAVVLVEDVTEAKVMERSKDEFFSIASHELRTPLTAIRGNTSMIKQFYADQLKDDELKSMINDIHDSSIRLIEIVNDFLDVSRLEQGKIEYKKVVFDANGLVEEVGKELKDIASEKKIYLKVEEGVKLPFAFADRDKIKQILLNLAGNSIKFTETGGVTIKLGTEGNFVKVAVSDTGRGIPIANQKLLFRKFQQAGSSIITRDTTKGTGLGLYISKLMIEGMGGQIRLEKSEEGKGSAFAFTIPLATAEQIAATKTTTAPAQPQAAPTVSPAPTAVPTSPKATTQPVTPALAKSNPVPKTTTNGNGKAVPATPVVKPAPKVVPAQA